MIRGANKTPLTFLVLILCSLLQTTPERSEMYQDLCDSLGERRVLNKINTLEKHGYVDIGVSTRTAWINSNGKELLDDLRKIFSPK